MKTGIQKTENSNLIENSNDFVKINSSRTYSRITVFEKFINECDKVGFKLYHFMGKLNYNGPAVLTNEKEGPTLHDVIRLTSMQLQWEYKNEEIYIVYPVV